MVLIIISNIVSEEGFRKFRLPLICILDCFGNFRNFEKCGNFKNFGNLENLENFGNCGNFENVGYFKNFVNFGNL